MGGRWWYLLVATVALFALACTEPLHHGLDEAQANQMVVELSRAGFAAVKEPDPADPALWVVKVPRVERVEAWERLEQAGLPRPAESGFGDFYPGAGLIPTAQEERVVLQYATAQEIRTSLLKIDGVVDAHVHLVLPQKARVQLSNAPRPEPRASVLVRWRTLEEEGPAVGPDEIRALVAGAVEELQPDQIEVVMTRVQMPPAQEREAIFAEVGPLIVAPQSAALVRALIVGMGLMIMALSAGLVVLVVRRRRQEGL
ncbi:hypothetical protein DL240_01530 [Lujinxingia litoralis]|uniref:Flagellar M-ring N-terminal domain-containing protein n=1 Tax=Lujinxingia litoralis TaxID=2211119 RepID=A0A328C8I0_9DELT|nr:hypothetical protein [Lujinxingia litoralis]RAL24917.1 hypothetical protein DL240_01530 [Lujinxingia litoralis]